MQYGICNMQAWQYTQLSSQFCQFFRLSCLRRLALLTCPCHFVKVEHGDNKLTKVNETRLKADVTQGKDNNLQKSECRSFVGQNVYFTIMTMSICCSASSPSGQNIEKFASISIGDVPICFSLSRKLDHWHYWKVCLATSTHQIAQLSHSG